MSIIFFFPLYVLSRAVISDNVFTPHFRCAISLYETYFDDSQQQDYADLLRESAEYSKEDKDPEPLMEADEFGPREEEGMIISKVKFDDLRRMLPDVTRSPHMIVMEEVSAIVLVQLLRCDLSRLSVCSPRLV